MAKKAFLGMIIVIIAALVLTGCETGTKKEERGGSITVVNTSDVDYYFRIYDPGNKDVLSSTPSVRAQGHTTVTVAKDDHYEIAYSPYYWYSSPSGRKYVNVSGGEKVTVEIP